MRLLSVFIFCFLTIGAWGQDFGKVVFFALDMNKPLTNTSWIGDGSARGAKFGYRSLLNDNFMAGVDINWATYDQYQPTITIERPGGAFTTDYFKYIYSYGITLNGHYLLPVKNKNVFMPYVGVGLGAALNSFASYYNIYEDKEDSWGFLVRPEIGTIFPFGGKIGALVSVHYDYSTTKSEFFDYNGFSNVGVQIGIVLLSY